MDVVAELREWAKIYLSSRDALTKLILGFDDAGSDFVVHKSSGDVLFLIRPVLSDVSEVVDKCQGSLGLVVLNTKRNVDFVLSNWQKFAQFKGLCIYFVNLVSNEKWLLYPFTHDQITDKSALRRGLESLFLSVPEYGGV